MKVFYTKTYNMSGANARKQESIEHFARSMGFEEISFFKFPDQYDSDDELDTRMDGIMAAMENDAVVLFQYPSMVSTRYDKCAIEHIKKYHNVKLIIMVQDLGCIVNSQDYSRLDQEIELLNQADLLILQSEMMQKQLASRGLHDIPIVYQEIWEYPSRIPGKNVLIESKLYKVEDISQNAFLNLNSAGVGVVSDLDNPYMDICNPFEVGFCLHAGIPIVALEGSRLAQFIHDYDVGFVFETLKDLEQSVSKITSEMIEAKKNKILKLQNVMSYGLFTKTMLQEAIYNVCKQDFT